MVPSLVRCAAASDVGHTVAAVRGRAVPTP